MFGEVSRSTLLIVLGITAGIVVAGFGCFMFWVARDISRMT